jgi:hypothetical protein|tara:strand:+ start:335 stop:475 length:141 start_codon:yes stop_codon:yes gene_type:complete
MRLLQSISSAQKRGPKKTSIGQGRGSKFGIKGSKKRYRKEYRGQGK